MNSLFKESYLKDLPKYDDYPKSKEFLECDDKLPKLQCLEGMKIDPNEENLKSIEAKFNILAQLCSIFRNDIQNMRK